MGDFVVQYLTALCSHRLVMFLIMTSTTYLTGCGDSALQPWPTYSLQFEAICKKQTNKQTNKKASNCFFFNYYYHYFPPQIASCAFYLVVHILRVFQYFFKKDVKLLLGLWRWKEIMQLAYFTNPSLLKTSETKNRKHFEESTQYVLIWHDSTLLT